MKLLCDVRSRVTGLYNKCNNTRCLRCELGILTGFDLGSKRSETSVLGQYVVISEINAQKDKSEYEYQDDHYPECYLYLLREH